LDGVALLKIHLQINALFHLAHQIAFGMKIAISGPGSPDRRSREI
jgi:hypothetical protein